ncbi:hypothetical protein FALCPG4_001557 [Fusarium falciforme]
MWVGCGLWRLLSQFSPSRQPTAFLGPPSPISLGALQCSSSFTHDLSATTDGFVRARALTSVISLVSSHGFGLERLHALSPLVHCPAISIAHSPVTRSVDPSAFLLPASSLEVVGDWASLLSPLTWAIHIPHWTLLSFCTEYLGCVSFAIDLTKLIRAATDLPKLPILTTAAPYPFSHAYFLMATLAS